MKQALLATTTLAALSLPAAARLQLSIGAGGSTFSALTGSLAAINRHDRRSALSSTRRSAAAFVQLTLTQSAFGKLNELSFRRATSTI